jgi:hypothetical protein
MAAPNETNKLAALDLAGKIYKVCCDERLQTLEAMKRHKIAVVKYPNFAQAYPVILRWLARDLKYYERAFRTFLDKLEKSPGKGMEGFIERQADYSRILYLEDCKQNHLHPNMSHANKLFQAEHAAMMKSYKKIREEERLAKNEFEEESADNIRKCRQGLLDFVLQAEPSTDLPVLDNTRAEAERLAQGLPLKNPNATFADINIDSFSQEEMVIVCKESEKFIKEKDKLIESLTTRLDGNTTLANKPSTDVIMEADYSNMNLESLRTQHSIFMAQMSERDKIIKFLHEKLSAHQSAAPAPSAIIPDAENPWLADTLIRKIPKQKKKRAAIAQTVAANTATMKLSQ